MLPDLPCRFTAVISHQSFHFALRAAFSISFIFHFIKTLTMRLSHVLTVPMAALLVAARIPRDIAPLNRGMLESPQSGSSTRNDALP
jgi:hypothetical protein